MKKPIKLSSIILLTAITVPLSGCVTLFGNGVVKAPCSATAGLTDPCGNRTPINTRNDVDRIIAEQLALPERV